MALNRVQHLLPEGWERAVGIQKPDTPNEEEVADAWRQIAEYPTTYSFIEDLNEAMQVLLRSNPTDREVALLKNYGSHITKMFEQARELMDKMTADYEKGNTIPNEEGPK